MRRHVPLQEQRVPLCLCANYSDNHRDDCPVMRHIAKYDAELERRDNVMSDLWKSVEAELQSPDKDLNNPITQAAIEALRRLSAVAC